ncbi:hypothetical protein K456DRAFT_35377 [Colletotrichum gloeosporioides 23]|nr:hypothetical protein K456DRAFT_35377 [Colletotrichum gloeosporioides 23]
MVAYYSARSEKRKHRVAVLRYWKAPASVKETTRRGYSEAKPEVSRRNGPGWLPAGTAVSGATRQDRNEKRRKVRCNEMTREHEGGEMAIGARVQQKMALVGGNGRVRRQERNRAETGGAFWELFSHSRYGMPDQTGQGGADAVELEALLDVRGRMRCNAMRYEARGRGDIDGEGDVNSTAMPMQRATLPQPWGKLEARRRGHTDVHLADRFVCMVTSFEEETQRTKKPQRWNEELFADCQPGRRGIWTTG